MISIKYDIIIAGLFYDAPVQCYLIDRLFYLGIKTLYLFNTDS